MEKENTKKTRYSYKKDFNKSGYHTEVKLGTFYLKRHTYITYIAKTQQEYTELSEGIQSDLADLLSEIDEDTLSVVEKTRLLIELSESEYPHLYWYIHNITNYMGENYTNFISNYVNLSLEGMSDESIDGPWKIYRVNKTQQECIDNEIDTFLNKEKAKYIWETSIILQIIFTKSIKQPKINELFNVKPPQYLDFLKRSDYTGKSKHEYADKCRDWRKKVNKQRNVKARRETKKDIKY